MKPRFVILLIIAAELLSLVGHFYPTINTAGFVVIIGATLIASVIKLEYGLYVALIELVIGGMGYLFSFPVGATPISIRLGIFLTILAVWLAKFLTAKKSEMVAFLKLPAIKWWGFFGLAIIWGLLMGTLHKNDYANIFLDANGYLYAVIILPFIWIMNRAKIGHGEGECLLKNFSTVFIVGTTWLAVKTLLVVYLYTHAGHNFIAANLTSFYEWVRDTGVGEITWLPGNLARVFFQSHIFNIAAFFGFLISLLFNQKKEQDITAKDDNFKKHADFYDREFWRVFFLASLNLAVIFIGLSRSFWAGTLSGLFLIFVYIFFKKFDTTPLCSRFCRLKFATSRLLIVAVAAIILILITARFPIPWSSPLDLSEATKSRLKFEAAASSRWNLLPPLWRAVEKHWFLGSGLGTTVTYISNDPRVRAESPTGLYTTYAFEWGWLDLWLKLGAIGLFFYITLLGWLIKKLLQQNTVIGLSGALVIITLAIISFFTPYLNHPLGFGILILLTTVVVSEKG